MKPDIKMSEREGRRRKNHSSRDHGGSNHSKKTLYRHDRDKEEKKKILEPKELLKPIKIQQPTILLKTRDKDPNVAKDPVQKAETPSKSTEAAGIQIQKPKPVYVDVTSTLWNPPVMPASVPLIDKNFVYSDAVVDFLMETSTDFLVVGVIGEKGVGKSTVMNLLAQNTVQQQIKLLGRTPGNSGVNCFSFDKNEESEEEANEYFKVETLKHVEFGTACTEGVDVYITCNRVILLDCEPMLELSVLSDMIENDVKPSATDAMPLENTNEIQSLQLATFLLTVCHVIILVDDWFCNSNMVRFLLSAEILKPNQTLAEDEVMEHSPHLLLLRNRVTPEEFAPKNYILMQNFYRTMFGQSKYHIETGLHMAKEGIDPCLSSTLCDDSVNLFLLPEFEENLYDIQPSLEVLVENLKSTILGATRSRLTSVQLNERTWFQYANKAWEAIKKNSFFIEYNKLMP